MLISCRTTFYKIINSGINKSFLNFWKTGEIILTFIGHYMNTLKSKLNFYIRVQEQFFDGLVLL